jgi:hypothetical protein
MNDMPDLSSSTNATANNEVYLLEVAGGAALEDLTNWQAAI